jgi:hypothetical protein
LKRNFSFEQKEHLTGDQDSKIDQLLLKFIYSEKAPKFCKISTLDLTITTWDKSTVDISQNFVTFSEYMNFNQLEKLTKSLGLLREHEFDIWSRSILKKSMGPSNQIFFRGEIGPTV